MIYFVRPIGGGPVKIGFTDNLDARIPQLQTEFGVRLEVLATLPGDRSTETEIHARFQEIRFKRTEQFLPTPELLEFIGVVLDPPPDLESIKPMEGTRRLIQISDEAYGLLRKTARMMDLKPGEYLSRLILEHAPGDLHAEVRKIMETYHPELASED